MESSQARASVAAAALEARQAEEEAGRAHAVTASLRRELEKVKLLLDDRESGLQGKVEALEQALAIARQESEAAPPLRRELEKLKVLAEEREMTLRGKLDALERALASARAEGALPLIGEEPLLSEPDLPDLPDFIAPNLEPVLDPGWGRLLRLVRPSVEAAYAHLRRLSAAPLKPGAKSLVRLAAASIGAAVDSLSSIELALAEGPAPAEPAPVLPALEQALSAWEPALRKRGITVTRDLPRALPAAPHEPAPLRVLVYHVLRNVLEAVPKGGKLLVKASKTPEGALRVEFADDGPGFPGAWLERRFEPFVSPRKGHAGLGLSIVRRTLRRWGGDAEASNARERGARLVLTFAPPLPPGPAMV